MGDRGTIEVKDNGGRVYLYTHWTGSDLEDTLRRAMVKRWRWGDGPYLTRIIFCEMVKGEEGGETGFGISSQFHDGNHLTVDVDEQKITTRRGTKSFEEFVTGEKALEEELGEEEAA
jgi:hypothetical protein